MVQIVAAVTALCICMKIINRIGPENIKKEKQQL